jgi:plasmid stability protein
LIQTKMQPLWFPVIEPARTFCPVENPTMPTTLTLKNIPDVVYDRLKAAAELHHRSLNSEAIVCLESVLLPSRVSPVDRLAHIRELRSALNPGPFSAKDIDAAKRAGRR